MLKPPASYWKRRVILKPSLHIESSASCWSPRFILKAAHHVEAPASLWKRPIMLKPPLHIESDLSCWRPHFILRANFHFWPSVRERHFWPISARKHDIWWCFRERQIFWTSVREWNFWPSVNQLSEVAFAACPHVQVWWSSTSLWRLVASKFTRNGSVSWIRFLKEFYFRCSPAFCYY